MPTVDQATNEIWRNPTAGTVFVLKFDHRGELTRHEQVDSGRRFNITSEEREVVVSTVRWPKLDYLNLTSRDLGCGVQALRALSQPGWLPLLGSSTPGRDEEERIRPSRDCRGNDWPSTPKRRTRASQEPHSLGQPAREPGSVARVSPSLPAWAASRHLHRHCLPHVWQACQVGRPLCPPQQETRQARPILR